MRASHYAQALYQLTITDSIPSQKLVSQFVETVSKNGHAHLLGKITKSFERIMLRSEKHSTIEVVSAEDLSQEQVLALLKREPYSRTLSASHKKVVRRTDTTLIGGTIVRAGAIRVDGSYKRTLIDLYQDIITSNAVSKGNSLERA